MVCAHCKKEFVSKRKWQRFCSKDCRLQRWLAENPRVKIAEVQNG